MSKARDLADSAQEINILDGKSFLDEDNLASNSATGIASQQSIKAYVDGITTTNITSTGALNSGSITSGFGNIDNGSSTITTTGAITGGSFVIGSADINENDLESIDGITAGTVAASKAVVVNANKDITGFRNLTATGTISGTLSGAIASTTTATTQAESDDSTKVATTAYVVDKITTLIGGAPSTLNDLNELAAAINDDANYNSTLTTALATKLPLAGGAMTGAITTNSTFDGVDVGQLKTDFDNLSTDILSDTSPQLGGALDVNGHSISFGDNEKARFGNADDLQIYHDGTNSYISDTGSGDLKITSNGNGVAINKNSSETMATFVTDGAVSLYYDNATKLATTSSGVNVTGNVTVTGTLDGRDLAADGVRLDTMATNANNYSHPNHSGEVTSSGDGAMTIANNVVDEANLKVSNSPTNGYVLSAQSGNTGGLTWAEAGGGSRALISRSVMNNTSAFVFTATDSSKYDSYYIELNGIVCSQSTRHLRMYISTDGGSSYLSQVRANLLQHKDTTRSVVVANGYVQVAYSVDLLSGSFGANVCGHIRLMNPHGGNTVATNIVGLTTYRGINPSGHAQNIFAGGESLEDYSQDGWTNVNAFKLQWNSGNLSSGIISVFGVLK